MKILARVHLMPPRHCAGAEMMLVALLRALIGEGHSCEVWLDRSRGPVYDHHGITVVPDGNGSWTAAAARADVLVTHLDLTAQTVAAAIALDKPLVQVLHNDKPQTRTWASCRADLLVYNSEWLSLVYPPHPNAIVVRPPVFAADYASFGSPGDKVTLINLNEAKGGLIFAMLAATFPDVEFLGVEGAYGEQLRPRLPNVKILRHGSQHMRNVYLNTRVLLMPSSYESWGRTGVEAMWSGIPVIAHPTIGLRESLGDAGIFAHRDDFGSWCAELRELMHGPHQSYIEASNRARTRAAQLDPAPDLALWIKSVGALA